MYLRDAPPAIGGYGYTLELFIDPAFQRVPDRPSGFPASDPSAIAGRSEAYVRGKLGALAVHPLASRCGRLSRIDRVECVAAPPVSSSPEPVTAAIHLRSLDIRWKRGIAAPQPRS